jgi:hypothetical protein
MTSTYATTETYSVVDVEKVVRSIRADLLMIASSSKAMTEEKAKQYAHDIEVLAKGDYLAFADLTLLDSSEKEVAACRFDVVTKDASGTSRPGVMWPATPDGRVRIVLSYTTKYTDQAREEVKPDLKIGWVRSTDDISHSALTAAEGRAYSSNGYGANRKDYS